MGRQKEKWKGRKNKERHVITPAHTVLIYEILQKKILDTLKLGGLTTY